MNIVKSLIVYMALTYAAAMGSAPPPAEMPTPTPVPTAAVMARADTPAPAVSPVTPEPTLAALATEAPTPVPAITPNKSYRILRRGDKGDNVRRMQERLRELGYLNSTIDGAFGNQTWKAVIAFQRANGLTPDGDAGPATLTVLYESPYVVPNLAAMTPTPVPTFTPGPDGLMPMPEAGTEGWSEIHLHTILYNGSALTRPTAEGRREPPGMWMRGEELMLSLADLSGAAGWILVADGGENFSLQAAGYDVDVTAMETILPQRQGGTGYFDAYFAAEAGVPVAIAQGDIVSENGVWYVSFNFLRQALKADVAWDEEENTLIIRVAGKSLSNSRD